MEFAEQPHPRALFSDQGKVRSPIRTPRAGDTLPLKNALRPFPQGLKPIENQALHVGANAPTPQKASFFSNLPGVPPYLSNSSRATFAVPVSVGRRRTGSSAEEKNAQTSFPSMTRSELVSGGTKREAPSIL